MKKRKNRLISGMEYWRCKKQIRKRDIDSIMGSGSSYQKWSRPDRLLEMSCIQNLLQAADFLEVTVDQLFEVHSVAELADGDRPQYHSKYADPGNCLSNYRIIKGLSFQQLGERLGVSPQYAQILCQDSRTPASGIERICAYEKMTPEEFVELYGREGVA